MLNISVSAQRLAIATAAVRKQDQVLRYLLDNLAELRWHALGTLLSPEPHFLELVTTELQRLRTSQKFMDRIDAARVHGAGIALWIAQREGALIIPGTALFAANPVSMGLTPDQAVEYWRKKLNLTDDQTAELLADVRAAAALTALQSAEWSDAVLLAVTELFGKAVAEGMTLAKFRELFSQIIPQQSRNNLEAIFRTGISRAFNDKRYQSAKETPGVVFAQFLSIPDERRTLVCKEMHGYIAGIDSGVWDRLTPPLHWNCRSVLSPIPYLEAIRRGILQYTADRRGLVATKGLLPYGYPPVPKTLLDPKRKRLVRVEPQPGFGSPLQTIPRLSSRRAA